MTRVKPPVDPAPRRAQMLQFLTEHAFHLLTENPGAPFSHETVAAAARVSARTVYRYFPAQSDLVASVWRHLRDSTGTTWPRTERSIEGRLRSLFQQFERNDALTRAMIAVAPEANVSRHGSVEGRAAFRGALAERLEGMSPDAGDQLVATCLSIYSAPFWQMLRDRGQLSPAAAADAACAAMQAVLDASSAGLTAQQATTPAT